MDLFSSETRQNLLPYDGIADYHGIILNRSDADHYLDRLLYTVDWRNDEAKIMGKHIVTKRKVAWYGDKTYAYTYSNTTKYALPWTKELTELKNLIEQLVHTRFNSCLLNLYHNGSEGMAWHSDDEKTLSKNAVIASVSLGAEREFSLRHKVTRQSVSQVLAHGSLLVMKGETQTYWQHRLPPTKKVTRPRINLTFRSILAT
ncbi:alpha-ketoglutarate-dependent dioxygenase AlkB [Fulvivirga sp. M361]|uniref:alpha-ketoglutarate-dependent dioxygenase AlkB family protein n=1 Tax=Fulvivirga sp. M361 TaxID=2594266 RepID=UPI00117BC5BB|nr:alpha-ketoglutarate-dependent dioxygenase AlkB [Fulvivirga sp. M361]TRX59901.1 alpha-ketoglutarate-dependent dioxygenase AlkB [Fulvivirga sp. M361]